MKRLKTLFAIILTAWLGWYLIGALYNCLFNPACWNETSRWVICSLLGLVTLIGTLMAIMVAYPAPDPLDENDY